MTKSNYDPILTSPKKTSMLEGREKQKAGAAKSRAEVWRLQKILSPQIHDATVSEVIEDDSPQHARIGLKRGRNENGVVSTGTDEQDEAARRADELERTLRGEPLADAASVEEKLGRAHRQWAAHESAIEHLNREIEKEDTALAIAYSKTKEKLHKDIMTRLGKTMLEAHQVLLEAYDLKRHLIDNSIGLRGLCLNLPESFLSTPNNAYSELADWFRAMKRDGFINSVPNEMKIV
jgi:hypothetical protein